MAFTMCSKKRCSTLSASFPLDRKLPVLGFGCLRNACLIATRDAAGAARVTLFTQTGRSKWTRPLPTTAESVSIVGVGDRAFAVGFVSDHGIEVSRLDRDGAVTGLWSEAGATTPPVLTWSSGRLLIARHHGDTVIHHVIPLAR
jgi:hypothetical protein